MIKSKEATIRLITIKEVTKILLAIEGLKFLKMKYHSLIRIEDNLYRI